MSEFAACLFKRNLIALLLTLVTSPAFAHARWFIDDAKIANVSFAFDSIYAAVLIGAALFVAAAVCLERAAQRLSRLGDLLFRRIPVPYDADWRILSSSLGYVLIATSFTQMVMAPNLKADESLITTALLAIQAVVGTLYLMQTRLRVAATLTIALPLLSIVSFSPLKVLDYAFEFIGLGLAFWTAAPQLSASYRTAPPAFARPSRIRRDHTPVWPAPLNAIRVFIKRELEKAGCRNGSAGVEAASLLRTMLGIQLIILAAHDKIFEPGVTLAFVEKYPFVNFPALVGISGFTNTHFVFGAGMAEIVLGFLLITNTGARLIAGMLAGLFTLTGLIFGLHELMGHMPILFSFIVLVTQGGAKESALASSSSRASPALGTALATILLGIIVISFEPKPVEARVTANSPQVTSEASALSVPAALYERFAASANPTSLESDTVRDANDTVRLMLVTFKGDTRTEKDDLASKLADLAIRYEMASGEDAASRWLRYAVLTAACSPSEIAAFQARVKDKNWQAKVARIPANLRAVLMPIAEQATRKVLKKERLEAGIPWAQLSEQAPTTGPGYIYTHTLACIARIITAVAEAPDTQRIKTTSITSSQR